LHNSNKQHLIVAKFYVNNTLPIGNKSAKFQLNLPKKTIPTAASVRSHPNTAVSGLCVWCHTQRPETEVFWSYLTEAAVAVICFGRFNWNLALIALLV